MIFYAADFVGHGLARRLVALSPLAQLIEYSRSAILGSAATPGYMLGAAIGANALLIAVALVFFKRLEPRFAEYV